MTLAIEDALAIELGHAGDGLGARAAVEVDDLLVGVLEGQEDGIGREGGEVRV